MEENTDRAFLIRDMARDERPREKALRYGVKSLSTAELMAIIFSTGLRGKSVIQLSNEILSDAGGHLSKVARMSVAEMLRRYKGVGQAKALALLAGLELGLRAGADARTVEDPVIRSSSDVYELMKPRLASLPHEEFWVMYLTQSSRVISQVNISRGGVAATAVDVKIILKNAIDSLASCIVLAHNHPSGTLSPSAQDDNLTRKIVEGAKIVDVRVLDHIIITDAGYYSYKDKGRPGF